jgi:uncharacterized membrane protein YfcA
VEPLHAAALVGAGAAAGAMNALAGGGTLVTFPALLFLGLPAKIANATSTVALVPGGVASFAAYRGELRGHRAWLSTLFVPSLVGGAAGSLLLLATPERLFSAMAPALVLLATLLFALQGRRRAASESASEVEAPRPATGGRRLGAIVAQTGVAVYGGYFGAGIGILMLAILGGLGLRNIHAMNGLKNFFGIAINGVAAAIFVASGSVDWPSALLILAGAVPGGFAGARFGQRIGQRRTRQLVVAIGLSVAFLLLLQRLPST